MTNNMCDTNQSPNGFIDIHAHLLPGVDDGCRNIKQTIQCIEQLISHGYCGTICTPHVIHAAYPDTTPNNISQWIDNLKEELANRQIEYHIWPGSEIQINTETLFWLQDVGIQPLGTSQCVLVDTWIDPWQPFADEVIDYIQSQGYRVILAHPERMPTEDLENLLADLQSRGVWLQGNFNSISGSEGPRAAAIAMKLLREDRYQFMAMDMHQPKTNSTRFEGLVATEIHVGPEKLEELIRTNPLNILAGEC